MDHHHTKRVPDLVADADLEGPAGQRVRWVPSTWDRRFSGRHADTLAVLETDLREHGGVRRDTVHGFAHDPVEQFVAAMVWGFGTTGYGAWRTQRMLEQPEAPRRIERIVETLRRYGAEAGYRALSSRTTKIRGLGPAFGTKLLYFAGWRHTSTAGLGPLILDANVSAGLLAAGVRIPKIWSSEGYRRYLELSHRWADQLDVEADAVECVLFQTGRNQA